MGGSGRMSVGAVWVGKMCGCGRQEWWGGYGEWRDVWRGDVWGREGGTEGVVWNLPQVSDNNRRNHRLSHLHERKDSL